MLTDGQETVFQGAGCLGLDGLHDVLAGEILVLFENGSELWVGTSGQNRIERRLVRAPLRFAWKTEPIVERSRLNLCAGKLYLRRSMLERPRRPHCDRLPRLPRGLPGNENDTSRLLFTVRDSWLGPWLVTYAAQRHQQSTERTRSIGFQVVFQRISIHCAMIINLWKTEIKINVSKLIIDKFSISSSKVFSSSRLYFSLLFRVIYPQTSTRHELAGILW